jgi:hypothetical protein
MNIKMVTTVLGVAALTISACGQGADLRAGSGTEELSTGGHAGDPCNDFARCAPGFECTRGPAEGVCQPKAAPSARTRLLEGALNMSQIIDRGGRVLLSLPVSKLLEKANDVRGSEPRTALLAKVVDDSKREDEGIEIFVPTNQMELLDLADSLAQ